MKLVISRSLIKTAAQRWKGQYFRGGKWPMGGPSSSNPEQVYEQLRQLDTDTCQPKAVADIIGNPSWSHYFCGSCHEYAERAVQIGDGYDESGAITCISCIRLALELLRPSPPPVREALSRLTAEVFAVLSVGERAMREAAGNSNVEALKLRAREAAEELAVSPGEQS